MDALTVRPMVEADLPAVLEGSSAAFSFTIEDPDRLRHWRARMAHPLRTDPDGAFVAVVNGRVVGAAEAIVRDRLWILSSLTVDPGAQSAGAGRALMNAALGYGTARTDAGLIVSSNDSRALRLYGTSGFRLLPALEAHGRVDLRRRPAEHAGVDVVEATGEDSAGLDPISVAARGAGHSQELALIASRGGRVLRLADRGFVVVGPDDGVRLLAARDEPAAVELLWAALASGLESEGVLLRWITHEQQWAITVALQAGLALRPYGAVCTRGRIGPLHPYLPSPPFA